MTNILELEHVSVIKNGEKILDSIDLIIEKGESVAIIGANGSGKTTLVKILQGTVHPYYDEKLETVSKIFDKNVIAISELRSKIGIITMDIQYIFEDSTKILEVILSGYFGTAGVYKNCIVTDEMIENAKCLATLLGIEDLLDKNYDSISLGESRRVLIARALTRNPEVLLMDEPMTGLDVVMRSKFRKMFDMLASTGVGLILVTHDLEDIPECMHRVIMIKDGKIFADGTKEDLLTSEKISILFNKTINVEKTNGSYSLRLLEEIN